LISKFDKIKKITNLTDEQLKEIVFRFVKRIDFIENELIDVRFQKEAYELVKDIDKKDLLFIALSLKTGFKLWTGDKKLMSGLAIKGFNNIISTQQLLEQFENSWE
jgi:predicted nucleic acid-binding protein